MVVRKVSLHFAVVTAFASGAASPAFAQIDGSAAPGSKEHVQSLLDQYAPGVRLDSMPLPPNAFRNGSAAASTFGTQFGATASPLAAGASADAAAARARAQTILNQYAPGVTLGAQGGVRVEFPGVPAVDTRTGSAPATAAPQTMLHRLAVDEIVRSLRDGDFARAARWVEAVAADLPKDGDVRQLESLVMLGEDRFYEAAEAAKAGLKYAAAWDDSRLRNVLPGYDDLNQSLRSHLQRSPEDGMAMFLMAYHERMLGRSEEALRILDVAEKYLPEGWLSASVRARFED